MKARPEAIRMYFLVVEDERSLQHGQATDRALVSSLLVVRLTEELSCLLVREEGPQDGFLTDAAEEAVRVKGLA